MDWKVIGKGYLYLMSMILIPTSWALIVGIFIMTFGPMGLFSVIPLIVLTIIHFVFNYDFS